MSGRLPHYEIRPFQTISDYRECVALQEHIWGEGFSERVSAAILKVSQHLGGVAAGAYDSEGRLIGFVFGMTGVDAEGLLHWSDMLGVSSSARDSGLGRQLKAYQREQLLARGVTRMVWTWDPLQSRNAYLNLTKLGAVAREYRRDMYGQTDSVLHRGIGTDRLLALWLMSSERVERRLAGQVPPVGSLPQEGARALGSRSTGDSGDPIPGDVVTGLDCRVISVAIPGDLDGLRARDLALARDWRERTRSAFEAYLDRGYEVRELVRGGPVSHYLMEKRNLDED